MANKWTEQAYVVLDQPTLGIPVYRVQVEGGTGSVRTLHRNMLLPIGGLGLASEVSSVNEAVKDPLASDVAVAGSSDRTNAVSDCDDSTDED